MATPININITGDLFLGRSIESIAKQSPEFLFDENILNIFSKSDFNIVNLESPLTDADDKHKLLKTGPNLKASPKTIGTLKVLKTDLVTLANNHIYDYGRKGLSDTLELCKSNNISTVGADLTFEDSKKTFFKEFDSLTIAVVNIAENEWCNSNEQRGGANPMNIIENCRSIQKAKKTADVVILIIHGGHELFHYPSPRMVEQYHFYAEQGASIIVGHHSHYLSGYEIYNEVPIFYGLGNFLFDSKKSTKEWQNGLLLNIKIEDKNQISWEIFPYKQCFGIFKVELLNGNEKLDVENKIKNINSIIANPEKLKAKFKLFMEEKQKEILSIFSTSYIFKYKYLRAAVRKLGIERLFLRKEQLKSILNYTRCEAHRDLTISAIDNHLAKSVNKNDF